MSDTADFKDKDGLHYTLYYCKEAKRGELTAPFDVEEETSTIQIKHRFSAETLEEAKKEAIRIIGKGAYEAKLN